MGGWCRLFCVVPFVRNGQRIRAGAGPVLRHSIVGSRCLLCCMASVGTEGDTGNRSRWKVGPS